MATHTDKDILTGNGVDFVITPWNTDLVTPMGYDLTIGVAATITGNSLNLSMSGKEAAPVTLKVPGHGKLLILSKESVWLSERVSGTLHSRGSLSAKGLLINSTTVDPNWQGPMTFLLHNVSDTEITVDATKPFVTLVLHSVLSPTETAYDADPFDIILERYKQYDEGKTELTKFTEYARAKQKSDSPAFQNLVVKAKARLGIVRFFVKRAASIRWFIERKWLMTLIGMAIWGIVSGILLGFRIEKQIWGLLQKLIDP